MSFLTRPNQTQPHQRYLPCNENTIIEGLLLLGSFRDIFKEGMVLVGVPNDMWDRLVMNQTQYRDDDLSYSS